MTTCLLRGTARLTLSPPVHFVSIFSPWSFSRLLSLPVTRFPLASDTLDAGEEFLLGPFVSLFVAGSRAGPSREVRPAGQQSPVPSCLQPRSTAIPALLLAVPDAWALFICLTAGRARVGHHPESRGGECQRWPRLGCAVAFTNDADTSNR